MGERMKRGRLMGYSMFTSLMARLRRRDAVIMELIRSVRRFITLVRGLLMDRTARCKQILSNEYDISMGWLEMHAK